MALPKIDYNALKAQTLGSGADEEAVTVNTRALIDKVLARYSGEWTVLRELLQNAADANAKNVTIRFETSPSVTVPVPGDEPSIRLKHVMQHHFLQRLVISNDGIPFSENDWARLKRIAEGNPDETKIGAFGVGFYSVFADCEEPLVTSGTDVMAFYWKGNSLFTRRSKLAPTGTASDTATNFVLDYRSKTTPIPSLLSISQFLATSLTFVELSSVSLWLDEWNVFKISKTVSPSSDIPIPKGVETRTNEGLMRVAQVGKQSIQINAEWMNVVGWKPTAPVAQEESRKAHTPSLRVFFSRLATSTLSAVPTASQRQAREEELAQQAISDNVLKLATATVFLRVTTANITTNVTHAFAQELERATKKFPPKSTKLAILTSSHDDNAASTPIPTYGAATGQTLDIFGSVLPSKSGRIFIGFPTHQTTGLRAHISAQSVIPTVEREAIDLNARWVRTWNMELLRSAGILARIAWAGEMSDLNAKLMQVLRNSKAGALSPEEIAATIPEALHTMRQFTFDTATPNSEVGRLIEEAFWMCNKQLSIELLSTRGVMASSSIRISQDGVADFVDKLPFLPKELMDGAAPFVGKLKDFGMLTEVTIQDVKREIEAKALTSTQFTSFLKWLGKKATAENLNPSTVRSLVDATIVTLGGDTGEVLVLSQIESYILPSRIPPEWPLPPSTLPYKFSTGLSVLELETLGWRQLAFSRWIGWIVSSAGTRLTGDEDMTASPEFAKKVLSHVSKQWDGLSVEERSKTASILSDKTTMPTRNGLKKPSEAYFPTVKLFPDLPLVTCNVKDKVLVALGVRKTVELNVVFERLMSPKAGQAWSHVDLIKYLVGVRADIPQADIDRLKSTPLCKAADEEDSGKRYKVSELYEPTDAMKKLRLPILDWPAPYRTSSAEGMFLSFLGLKKFPTLTTVVQILAESEFDPSLQDSALAFLFLNYHTHGYKNTPIDRSIKFLPVQDKKGLYRCTECFYSPKAVTFGFHVLRHDLHPHAVKLGVAEHPPLPKCIDWLIQHPPETRSEAKKLFEYFSSRHSEFTSAQFNKLGEASVIPLQSAEGKTAHLQPRVCYLGSSTQFAEIFDFVDFGTLANAFLNKCGAKFEPTKSEIARRAVQEPQRLLDIFGSLEKYTNMLRLLATGFDEYKKDHMLFGQMRRAPFLLVSKDVPMKSEPGLLGRLTGHNADDEDEERITREWQLGSASQAVIINDFNSFNLFRESILAAPQEEVLEEFYLRLGAPTLSSLVKDEPRISEPLNQPEMASKLHKRILERSKLFLHEHSENKIQRGAKWLESQLSVQIVRSIALRRSLKGYTVMHSEKRTALITNDRTHGYVLWATESPDYYHISQALVPLILKSPKPVSSFLFETFLSTDLMTLKARGYNVDRILRQKAAEQRLAAENKRKQDIEQQRLKEERDKANKEEMIRRKKEADSNPKPAPVAAPAPPPEKMPGAFGPDTFEEIAAERAIDRRPSPTPSEPRRNHLLSSLNRRFGFDDNSRRAQQLHSLLGGRPEDEVPPPYSDNPAEESSRGGQGGAGPLGGTQGRVSTAADVDNSLKSAINASRPWNSNQFFSRPRTEQITEQHTYCDTTPSEKLDISVPIGNGMRFYFATPSISAENIQIYMDSNRSTIDQFSNMLMEISSEVFKLPAKTINIFYDPQGSTIAFNSTGSIFCNFHYYEKLHKELSPPQKQRSEAMVYWWVVMCHELAHNLVEVHSAEHGFYTQGFVTQYFPAVMAQIMRQ